MASLPRSPAGTEPRSVWPSDDELVTWWPQLGRIAARRVQGSGLRLTSSSGPVHLKRRPVASIDAEIAVLAHLASCGLPVTVPLPTLSGGSWQPWDGDAVWMYRELPGLNLQLHMAEGAHRARLLGRACARLARALDTIETADAQRWGVPVRLNQRACSGLPTQVIHRDFHAGNVLFSHGLLTGYLDFDHIEIGPRVLDLCYAASSLLALMAKGPDPQSWLTRWRALVEGYVSIAALTDLELSRTAELMIANQHDFVTWFESRRDADNVALTINMIDFFDMHSRTIVAEAQRTAHAARTSRHRE